MAEDRFKLRVGIDWSDAEKATATFIQRVNQHTRTILATGRRGGTGASAFTAGRELEALRREAARVAADIERRFQLKIGVDSRVLTTLNKLTDPTRKTFGQIPFGVDTRHVDPVTGGILAGEGKDPRRYLAAQGLGLKPEFRTNFLRGVDAERRTEAAQNSARAATSEGARIQHQINDILEAEKARLAQRYQVAALALGETNNQLRLDQSITQIKGQVLAIERRRRAAEAAALDAIENPGVRYSDVRTRRTLFGTPPALEAPNPRDLARVGQRPTLFQRGYAYFNRRQGVDVDPFDSPRIGQFLGSRLLTTVGFGLSGGLLYGALSQMREIVREASNLQVQFGIIEGVLRSTGQTGEDSFRRVREGVLDVARDTATAADTVASVQRQLAGAFAGASGVPDFGQAELVSRTAFQLARVTGLPDQEITDSLTAAVLAFNQEGQTFDQTATEIGDLIVGLENQFGVLSTQVVQFTADLAPLGAELGFTARELATIGAAAQSASGQSGGSLAEQFRRIIPGLQARANEIVALFPGQTGDDLARAFGADDIAEVVRILLRSYDSLDRAGKNALATIVGGRREAGAFLALLNQNDRVLASLDGTSERFSGALEDRFSKVSESLKFSFDELERAVEELGIALFEAGLADGLKAIVEVGTLLVDIVGALAGGFTRFNEALAGIPARLLAIAAAMKAVSIATSRLGVGQGVSAAAATVGPRAVPLPGVPFPGAGGAVLPSGAALPPGFAATGTASTSRLAAIGRGGAYAAAILAVTELVNTAQEIRAEATSQREELEARVLRLLSQGQSGEQITANLPGGAGGDVATRLGNFFRGDGFRSSSAAVLDEVQRTEAEFFRPVLEAAAEAGDDRAEELLAYLDSRFGRAHNDEFNAQLRAFIEDVRSGRERDGRDALNIVLGRPTHDEAELIKEQLAAGDAERRASAAAERSRADTERAIEAYTRGSATQGDVLEAFAAEIRIIQGFIDGALAEGKDPTQYTDQLDELLAQRNSHLADTVIAQRFDLIGQISDIVGGRAGSPDAQLALARQRLAALQAAGVTGEELLEGALGVYEALAAVQDQAINDAGSLAEQIAIFERGISVDPQARAIVTEQVLRVSLGDVGNSIAELTGTEVDDVFDALTAAFIETNSAESGLTRKALAILRQRIRRLQDFARQLAALIGKDSAGVAGLLSVIQALQGQVNLIDSAITTADETLSQLGDAIRGNDPRGSGGQDAAADAQAAANARLDVLAAQANGDAIALAAIARERAQVALRFARTEAERLSAQAQIIEANNQLNEAYRAAGEAQSDLRVAQSGDDPILAAAEAIGQADIAIRQASGIEQEARALAERIRAERSHTDAVLELMDAEGDIYRAIAERVGDTVAIAQIGLDEINRQLARTDLNPTERRQLEAEHIRQTTALGDAQLQEAQDLIDFNLQMGNITRQQALAQLSGLLQLADSDEETRALLLRIRQLSDDLGQDYRFNLPTQLGLPTLYEGRRLGQSTASGIGYQDNRNISVTVVAQTNADPNKIAQTVKTVVGEPSRNGVGTRRY